MMNRRHGALLLLLGATAFVACDDADGGSVVDGGGGAATSGDKGGSGGSGSAGTVNAPDCFPACIARIREACRRPTTGTCVHQDHGRTDNYCYSNGVKESVEAPPYVRSEMITFFTPAGAPCYSTEVVSPPASAVLDIVFKDADGKEVARGKRGVYDFKWQLTCDGQTFMVDEYDAACDSITPGKCTDGACR